MKQSYVKKNKAYILLLILMFIVCFENDQNVLRDGTVSTVAKNAHDIVETALYVIT